MKNLLSSLNKVFLLTTAVAFIYACTSETAKEEEEEIDDISTSVDAEKNVSYKLPSPVELYIFLRQYKARFNKEALNPVENYSKYYTTTDKALNLGIYSSDLAYCTVFEKNQETFQYFKSAKILADGLGLMEGFDNQILKRIDENINNSDSLYKITTDSYWDACTYLENEEQINLLPFIIIGGWVESVHIAINSVDKFSTENETIIRIAEQQFLLENLVDYFNSIKENEQFNEILVKLLELKNIYDKLYENKDVIITKEQYNEISTKIETLRSEFVS